jgi:hypothetical protein
MAIAREDGAPRHAMGRAQGDSQRDEFTEGSAQASAELRALIPISNYLILKAQATEEDEYISSKSILSTVNRK